MQAQDLNDILDKSSARALMVKNDISGLVQLGIHLGLIALAGWLVFVSGNALMLVLTTLVLGVLLTFLFAPLHESIHKTAFKSQALNSMVGWLCGLVIVLPPRYFQAFHMAHHRHTQIPGKDPELDTPKPTSLLQYIVLMSGLVYWKEQIVALAKMASGKVDYEFVAEQRRSKLVAESRVFLFIYVSVFCFGLIVGFELILKYWIIPILLGQPFLRLYLVAEHTLCPTVPDMLVNTRTTISNSVVRFLAWNMPYHVEHHAWPAIPFHKLPEVHQRIKPRIEFLSPGYIAVNREILKSIATSR